MDQQEWLLKRNCSLSPRQLGQAYAVLCVMSLAVASLCVAIGVWQIVFFTILELGVVALAFLVYARHATDHEHISLNPDCLLIEQFDGPRVQRVRLDPRWVTVAAPSTPGDLIRVQSRGVEVEIGRHVDAARRREVARQLQRRVPCAAHWPHAA